LLTAIENFNELVVKGRWAGEVDLSGATSTPIAVLEEIEETEETEETEEAEEAEENEP
jgi:hypothetical protein